MASDLDRRDTGQAPLTPGDFNLGLLFDRVPEAVVVFDAASTRIVLANPAAEALFGYAPGRLLGQTLDTILPGSPQWPHLEAIERYATSGQEPILDAGAPLELPAQTRGGRMRLVELRLSALPAPAVPGSFLLAVIRDISDRRRGEQASRRADEIYRGIVENAVDGIYQSSRDGRFLRVNPALARILGYESPRALLESLTDIATQFYVVPGRREEFIRQVERHQRVTDFESLVYRADGSIIWVSETARAVRDRRGRVRWYEGTVQDITARRRAAEEQAARAIAEAEQDRLAFLSEASALLASSLDYEDTLAQVARLAVPFLADACAVDLLDEAGTIRRVASFSTDPERDRVTREIIRRYPLRPDSGGGVAIVLREGTPLIQTGEQVAALWEEIAEDAEHLALLHRLGIVSRMVVPLLLRGETLGAISLALTSTARRFEAADVALAQDLARRAAVAIDNARLYRSLSRSEQRFRALLQNATDVIVVIGTDRTVRYASPPLRRVLGYDPDAIVGRDPSTVIHSDDTGGVQSIIRQVIAEPGGRTGRELRVRHADGSWRVVEVTVTNLVADPVVRGVVVNLHDITERKAIEEDQRFLAQVGAVLASSLEYDTTLSQLLALSLPRLGDWCAIDTVGAAGTITRIAVAATDPEIARTLGDLMQRLPIDPEGAHPVAIVLRTGESAHTPDMSVWLTQASATEEERRLVAALRTGSRITVPLIAHGRRLGALSFGYLKDPPDREERRHQERDLALAEEFAERAAMAIENARLYHEGQAALAEATEALGLRDQFLSVASHELRTPLTALKGQIQLAQRRLAQGQIERVGALIEHADVQVARLARLVRDLLDVSRIAAGGFPIVSEPVALGALIQRVVEIERAAVPGRAFELDLPESAPTIWADSERIEQVLINLMENARKYSSAPTPIGVSLRVAKETVSISVSDHGVGIPSEEQARIFERFHRAENVDRNIAGLGLGLYIAREIVQAHGGSLSLVSAPGEGSTFTVTLPRRAPQEADGE